MPLSFENHAGQDVPRQKEQEAIASIRGYAWQFLHVADRLLAAPVGAIVYVEAFEDILTVADSILRGEQGKDREGEFSITQQASCDMLERWAQLAAIKPDSEFVFFSTQSAGGSFDKSEAFKKWAEGTHTDELREQIRDTFSGYLSKRSTKKDGTTAPPLADTYPTLSSLASDENGFRGFWERITWQLRAAKAPDLFDTLLLKVRAVYPNDPPNAARPRLLCWLGAIAWSAAQDDLDARGWTLKKLKDLSPSDQGGFGAIASLFTLVATDTLSRTDEIVSKLGEVLELMKRPAREAWRPTPGSFARSPRLDKAASELRTQLKDGAHLVALLGRPGDGKTQVARRLAAETLRSIYLELSSVADPSSAWEAILRTACSISPHSEVPPGCEMSELLARYRAAMVRESIALVVFDNVDGRPPFALEDLVPGSADFACILVGPGSGELPRRVSLDNPSDEEFISIATGSLPANTPLTAVARDTLARIAVLADHSALAAKCIGISNPDFFEDDLVGFETDLAAARDLTFEDRIQAAFRKSWAALDPLEQQRVVFVAATGEPKIPLAWLPPALRGGPPKGWRMLADAGAAVRSAVPSSLRIHRLFALGAISQSAEGVAEKVVAALIDWARSPEYTAELKADGPRQRAFVRLFEFAQRKGALPADEHAHDRLLNTFLDCSRSERSDASQLEALFGRLWPAGPVNSALGVEVAARLLDVIAVHMAKESHVLAEWRKRAFTIVDTYVAANELPTVLSTPSTSVSISDIYRHFAKAVAKTDKPRAAETLEKLVTYCMASAKLNGGCEWVVQAAKATLQFMKALRTERPGAAAKAGLDQLQFKPECLPAYLRLATMQTLLQMRNVPSDVFPQDVQLSLAKDGLRLCDQPGNTEVRGEFLAALVRQIELAGAYDLYPEVRRTIAPIVDDYAAQGSALSLNRFTAGHVVVKAAGMGTGPDEYEAICSIVRLYASFDATLGQFHLGRIAAAYRELRLFQGAESVAIKASGIDSGFDHVYELAKINRWKGDYGAAEEILLELTTKGERLEAVRDERAKLLIAQDQMTDAHELLSENVKAYRQDGKEFFASRCELWLSQPIELALSETGLRQDEWRSVQRRQAVASPRLNSLDEEMARRLSRFVA